MLLFFKATIGIFLNESVPVKPVSAMYLVAEDYKAVEEMLREEKDVKFFLFDKVIKIEVVDEEEINQNCYSNLVKKAKKIVTKGSKKAFHISSKMII